MAGKGRRLPHDDPGALGAERQVLDSAKMIAEVLEADRKAMGLDQYEYIGHLLARRYNEIRDQGGAGFEKKAKGHK